MTPRARGLPALALGLALAAPGCARDDGGFLLELLPDTIAARLGTRTGRYDSDGWLRTAEGYALRLDSLQIAPSGLTLLGGAALAPLVTLQLAAPVPVSTRVPATALAGVPLGACTPGCGLEGGTIDAALLPLTALRAEGLVRDRTLRRLAAPTPFLVDLALPEEVLLRQPLALRLDRRAPERLALSAIIEVTVEIGDGVDWAQLPRDGGRLCLGAAPPCDAEDAGARLRRNLAASVLTVDLSAPPE